MRSEPIHHRTRALLMLVGCVLLPALLALVAVGMGSAAGSTQGLTQATGALAVAALQGLDRRAPDDVSPIGHVALPPAPLGTTLADPNDEAVHAGTGHPLGETTPVRALPLRV